MGADMGCFYSRLGHVTPEHPEVFFPTFFPVNYGKMAKDRHFASSCISLLLSSLIVTWACPDFHAFVYYNFHKNLNNLK